MEQDTWEENSPALVNLVAYLFDMQDQPLPLFSPYTYEVFWLIVKYSMGGLPTKTTRLTFGLVCFGSVQTTNEYLV